MQRRTTGDPDRRPVIALGRRIERWRRMRRRRSPMPRELWSVAAALARERGVYAVARAVGVDYGALKRRAEAHSSRGARARIGEAPCNAPAGPFVELSGADLLGAGAPTGPVIELSASDGMRLVVRLPPAARLDVGDLLRAFGEGRA